MLVVLGLSACAAPCGTVCRKLERCELDPAVLLDECVEACDREIAAFRALEDKTPADRELHRAYNRHRTCLANRPCDDIAEGACYDPEIFPFDGAGVDG